MTIIQELEVAAFSKKSFWYSRTNISTSALLTNIKVTEEILREISELKKKKGNYYVMPEIYGQEGAAPGTTTKAPTNDALRTIDPDTLIGEFDAE